MTPAFVAILYFALCSASPRGGCDEGQIEASTCAEAEASMRAAMRPGQTLIVWTCEVSAR